MSSREAELLDSLFAHAMKGEWREVVKIYERSPKARKSKITKSEDTALHIAITVGQTVTAIQLVNIIVSKDEPSILRITDSKGNTALHVAAVLGDTKVCECMVEKCSDLATIRNLKGETPLFLVARHGKKEAFFFLHLHGKEDYHVRRNDGDTILHAAIIGEYFSEFFVY